MTTQAATWAGDKTAIKDALRRAGFKVDVAQDDAHRMILLAAKGESRNVIIGRPPQGARPCNAFWLFKPYTEGLPADEFIVALEAMTQEGGLTP